MIATFASFPKANGRKTPPTAPLTWFLDTSDAERYAKSEKSLQAFVKDHPSSTYLPDACYRLAVCKFAFQ